MPLVIAEITPLTHLRAIKNEINSEGELPKAPMLMARMQDESPTHPRPAMSHRTRSQAATVADEVNIEIVVSNYASNTTQGHGTENSIAHHTAPPQNLHCTHPNHSFALADLHRLSFSHGER